ncbi:hypothetical protein AVEN_82522-1 [Araneus ventricosus]|uniref:Uncharacterized protein n=1 Tax=Araneus ventricosus TaxID=182803 RepID=A0A4Y2K8A5_ARAVE|nr:hypothetical protein AVEN_82522-1 [Araneus ventricosus]
MRMDYPDCKEIPRPDFNCFNEISPYHSCKPYLFSKQMKDKVSVTAAPMFFTRLILSRDAEESSGASALLLVHSFFMFPFLCFTLVVILHSLLHFLIREIEAEIILCRNPMAVDCKLLLCCNSGD